MLKPAFGGFLVAKEMHDDQGANRKSADHELEKKNTFFHPRVPRR